MKLYTHEALVTHVSDEVYNLACLLDIPTDISHNDDHIYIKESKSVLSIVSHPIRCTRDVMVSSEVFCELLMDIKGGMSVLEAFNKQGYTFYK